MNKPLDKKSGEVTRCIPGEVFANEILYAIKGFDGAKALYFFGNSAHLNSFNATMRNIEHFEIVINSLKEALDRERENYELLFLQMTQ